MAGSVKQSVLAAFRGIMGPLVRILLRQGISFAEFSEVAKAAYVEVAVKDFKVEGRRATRTRIAVLTGLTRKEVKRIIDDAVNERYELKTKYNRLSRVLVGWHTDPDFITADGVPLELRYENDDPDDLSFTLLVKRHSGDMSPRSILDELVRVEAVAELDEAWFRVLRRDYIPEAEGAHQFARAGIVVRNFINTIDFNVTKTAPGQGRFERQVVADDGIRAQDVGKFDEYLRERCQNLLEELDDWLTNLPKPNLNKGDQIVRTGLGIYHYLNYSDTERSFKNLLIDEGLIKTSALKGTEHEK